MRRGATAASAYARRNLKQLDYPVANMRGKGIEPGRWRSSGNSTETGPDQETLQCGRSSTGAFGLLRLRTGSLVPPILAHALLNTITFVTVVVTGIETDAEIAEAATGAALLVGGCALTVMAMRHARPPLTPPDPTPRLAA